MYIHVHICIHRFVLGQIPTNYIYIKHISHICNFCEKIYVTFVCNIYVFYTWVIMETTSSSEREPVTTTAILLTCFSQLDFSTAARAHLIEGEWCECVTASKGGRGNSGHTFGCRNSKLYFRQQKTRTETKTTAYWNFIYVLSVSQVIVFNDDWQDENKHV